jgi:hypothetical protein
VGVAVKVDSDSDGFSQALDFLEVGPDSFSVSSLGAVALGERLRSSLSVMLVMSESGAPIYPSVQIDAELSSEIEGRQRCSDGCFSV